MRIDLPELLELLSVKYCRTCSGEGTILYIGGSGYFDPHMGNWYPSEEIEPCDECYGTGDYHHPPGKLGRITERLDQLTQTERAGLLHLFEQEDATLTSTVFQALWQLLEDLELETEADDPATIELHALLANCTVINDQTPPPADTNQAAPTPNQ